MNSFFPVFRTNFPQALFPISKRLNLRGILKHLFCWRQWREAGRWPDSYDRLWGALMRRQGKLVGTREMIELLLLGRQYGYARLEQAVTQALGLGCSDAAAVRHLVVVGPSSRRSRKRQKLPPQDLGALSYYERPQPAVREYDQLLIAFPGSEVLP